MSAAWFNVISFGLFAAGFFVLLMVLGMVLDGISHDRCLKHATKGLEIHACR